MTSHDITVPPSGVKCPDCGVRCMPLNCGPVVVDRCRQCGGLWFDDKEIGVFKSRLQEMNLSELVAPDRSPRQSGKSISACPRCHVIMQEFIYGVNTKVTPQHCLRCYGIWLDPYQLKLFLELARLTQELHPHIVGIAKALEEESRYIKRWQFFGRIGDLLNVSVNRGWGWRRRRGLLDWFLDIFR